MYVCVCVDVCVCVCYVEGSMQVRMVRLGSGVNSLSKYIIKVLKELILDKDDIDNIHTINLIKYIYEQKQINAFSIQNCLDVCT